MAAEYAVKARLLAATGVTSLVGTRVNPLKLEQNTVYPAVTYRVINRQPNSLFQGDAALSSTVVEVESFGATYSSARSTADAVKSALQRWSGTATGVTVQQVFFNDEISTYDPEIRHWAISQDYTVWTEEQ